jgi:predicted nucleotidyltransferase
MSTTANVPPEVNQVAERLVSEVQKIMRSQLFGVYLFGSATTGAFESGISDLDTVVVLSDDPTDDDISAFAAMHERIDEEAPEWNDRIELHYLSARALAEFRNDSWPAARISPGEPFHRIRIDSRWVLDWYQVRTTGIALYGPPSEELIPDITGSEFVEAIRQQVREWPDRLRRNSAPGGVAYAVLTLCRAFRACISGEYLSKIDAAKWAIGVLPDFRAVIEDAVRWRYDQDPKRALDRESAIHLAEVVERHCANS